MIGGLATLSGDAAAVGRGSGAHTPYPPGPPPPSTVATIANIAGLSANSVPITIASFALMLAAIRPYRRDHRRTSPAWAKPSTPVTASPAADSALPART